MYVEKGNTVNNRLQKNDFDKESMKPYLLVIIFLFYTLPVVFALMKESGEQLMLMQVFALNPIVIFIVTMLYTVRVGTNVKFPILVAAIFLPTIFIFYGMTGLAYDITYAVISYVALAAGALINRFLK